MIGLWMSYGEAEVALTHLHERHAQLRREIRLMVDVGDHGGSKLKQAAPILEELSRIVPCYPAIGCLGDGDRLADWEDRGWRRIADQAERVIEWARAHRCAGLVVDLEPRFEGQHYPTVSDARPIADWVCRVLISTRPLVRVLRTWPGRLYLAANGLDCGIMPLIAAQHPRAVWMDSGTVTSEPPADYAQLGLSLIPRHGVPMFGLDIPYMPGFGPWALTAEARRRIEATIDPHYWVRVTGDTFVAPEATSGLYTRRALTAR